MCGRFTLFILPEELSAHFRLNNTMEFEPRYNIAQKQIIPCIVHDVDEPGHATFPLGADRSLGKKRCNRFLAFQCPCRNSCQQAIFLYRFQATALLIPTSGFFEWKSKGTRRLPYLIGMRNGQPFAFAGIWEKWIDPENHLVETCSILTTSANDLIGKIHNRMPVILNPADYDRWLAPDTSPTALDDLLKPYPADLMVTCEVSDLVNNPRCEAPECIQKVN